MNDIERRKIQEAISAADDAIKAIAKHRNEKEADLKNAYSQKW